MIVRYSGVKVAQECAKAMTRKSNMPSSSRSSEYLEDDAERLEEMDAGDGGTYFMLVCDGKWNWRYWTGEG